MNCISPIRLKNDKGQVYFVPCQKCAWCRRSLRDQWVFRMEQEKLVNPYARFLTLTYDDDHLPMKVNEETGEMVQTVKLADIQSFHKDMWNDGKKFRFVLASEYGPRTQRPHYHGIYFSKDRIDYLSYWKFGQNNCDVPAKKSSFKYVLKYMLKGSHVPPGAEDNFKTVSRRPGIGSNFVYKGEPYVISAGGVKVVPGHYYQRNYVKSLDEKLRKDISSLKMEYLVDTDPFDSYKKLYNELGINMDFDSWLSEIYQNDYKKQLKINRK